MDSNTQNLTFQTYCFHADDICELLTFSAHGIKQLLKHLNVFRLKLHENFIIYNRFDLKKLQNESEKRKKEETN